MLLILALLLAAGFIAVGYQLLKKHSTVCYITAAAISAAVPLISLSGAQAALPGWVQTSLLALFSRGAFATALFIIVMYTGALRDGSSLMKLLLPIRAELSILASILTLAHNITSGATYFKMMLFRPEVLTRAQFAAGILTIILMCMMIPLAVTSFPAVRRRMSAKKWKAMQRTAYLFYGLLYVHVMLLSVPGALAGRSVYQLTVLAYSIVFLTYGVMRVRKALLKKRKAPAGTLIPVSLAVACLMVICFFTVYVPTVSAANVGGDSAGVEESLSAQDGDLDQTDSASQESTESIGAETITADEMRQETSTNSESVNTAVADESVPAEVTDSETSQTAKSSSETATSSQQGTQASGDVSSAEATASVTAVAGNAAASQTTATTAATANSAAATTASSTAAQQTASTAATVTYKYQNGTFSGSGEGFAGTITVQVTMKNDTITAITVTDHSDDEPYFSAAKELIETILSSQSTKVDTVSGATYSSKGIIAAVKNALSNAEN